MKRFNVIVLHRRAGKTVLAINQLIKEAVNTKSRAARYAYIAPLYRQAKSVALDFVKHYTSTIPGTKYNESELRVDLVNGARINLYGADNPDSLRGLGLDGVVIDEYAQTKDELWGGVIRPMLVDREGWAIFIGTPSSEGLDEFYRLYTKAVKDPDWFTALYRASETKIISDHELEQARGVMTHEQYMREFEVDFHIPSVLGFNRGWLNYWENSNWTGLNRYIFVDPANEKRKKSDYTAIIVVGIGEDNNYYIVDMVRDRLNLTERTDILLQLHKKYKPLGVFYEKYGKDSDIQHIEYVQEQTNYRFQITAVAGVTNKVDRIRTSLVPLFQTNRIYLPHSLLIPTGTGLMRDIVKEFEEEYLAFPKGLHDDMIDCLARITDEEVHKIVRAPNQPAINMRPAYAEGATPVMSMTLAERRRKLGRHTERPMYAE